MLISVDTSVFYKCLEIVEKALPSRTTMPLINNIFFEAGENGLVFSATNLEMEIMVNMPYPCSESGKILLPPKIIEIMRSFITPEINIEINWDTFCIEIYSGEAVFHLHGSDPQDYPVNGSKKEMETNLISIEQYQLKRILKSVSFVASSDESRPAFNGILFQFIDNRIILTASDTYRLVIKEITDEKWQFIEKKCLVPVKSMRELLRILNDDSMPVVVTASDNKIAFRINQIYFTTRLLSEKFPEVRGIIPKEYRTRVVVERKIFEETVYRAALLAEGKNQAVNLSVRNNKMEAKVSAAQGSMKDLLLVEQEGEDIELYVNTRFILDLLKIIDDKQIIIDMHGEEGPLIFRLKGDHYFLYLVFPIRKIN